tara:strand:+ start:879 stop:1031 length:153 start_codon:yes stop_codon:yes gene_type:complete
MKMSRSDVEELYRMASNYNYWDIDSMRYTLYELKSKLSAIRNREKESRGE